MDEKDRLITEIYNESKERARWMPNSLIAQWAGNSKCGEVSQCVFAVSQSEWL